MWCLEKPNLYSYTCIVHIRRINAEEKESYRCCLGERMYSIPCRASYFALGRIFFNWSWCIANIAPCTVAATLSALLRLLVNMMKTACALLLICRDCPKPLNLNLLYVYLYTDNCLVTEQKCFIYFTLLNFFTVLEKLSLKSPSVDASMYCHAVESSLNRFLHSYNNNLNANTKNWACHG